VGPDSKTKVKAGRTVLIKGDETTVAKFDKDTDDPLDMWSQSRAKDLAKANAGLQRNALRSTLVSSFNGRGWNMYDSFGLWIFDPMRHSWCFLPFGSGWGSPYGYYYGLDTWNCRLPRWMYSQPAPGGSVAGPVAAPAGPDPRKGESDRPLDNGDTHGRLRPPYQQIENNERGGGEGIVRGGVEGVGNRRIGLPKDDGNWNPSMPDSSPGRASNPGSSMPSMPSAPAPSAPSISLPRSSSREKPD